jgi:hypothetical protein
MLLRAFDKLRNNGCKSEKVADPELRQRRQLRLLRLLCR